MAKKTEAPAEDEAVEGEAPKKSKKKLFIILILVFLLGALGAGGWFGFQWWTHRAPASSAAAKGGGHAPAGEAAKGEHGGEHGGGNATAGTGEVAGDLVSIPPLLVNLADPEGRRYLKLALDVEVRDKAVADELNKNMPKVKDALLLLLSSKTYDDLSTLEDKILLKKEIVDRLTLILGEQKVNRVYITEIIIQ